MIGSVQSSQKLIVCSRIHQALHFSFERFPVIVVKIVLPANMQIRMNQLMQERNPVLRNGLPKEAWEKNLRK